MKSLTNRTPWVKNKKERKRILIAIAIVTIIVLFGLFYYIPHVVLIETPLHTRAFKSFIKKHGSLARLGFFFALSHFVLHWCIKRFSLMKRQSLKRMLLPLSKIVRGWHVPVAIFALGMVLIHASAAILNGWEWQLAYISGTISLLLLIPLTMSGILRYKMLDRKKHLFIGIGFTVMFLLHSILG
jgi:hypothetical protein